MTAKPSDAPVFNEQGQTQVYFEFPTEYGRCVYTWLVDEQSFNAVYALLRLRGERSPG